MSALDLKLINEFKMIPALYNRNNSRFKDKVFVERSWNHLSKKLGYNPNILKDRMYQLRNRYNLEKRKLQAMRDEGIINPKPMWPLYHNLNFLSGHIRQRKSYKMMRSVTSNTGFRGFTKEEGRYRIGRPYTRNVEHEIKQELDDQHYETLNETLNPPTYKDETMNISDIQPRAISKTSQTLKNINILKKSLLEDDCSDDASGQKKIPRNHHSSHKFEAFGSFVNNSLQDLPQHKALAMVERFTSELVRALTVYRRLESSNR